MKRKLHRWRDTDTAHVKWCERCGIKKFEMGRSYMAFEKKGGKREFKLSTPSCEGP